MFTGFKAPSDQITSHSVAYTKVNRLPNLAASGQVVVDPTKRTGKQYKGHVVFDWTTGRPTLVLCTSCPSQGLELMELYAIPHKAFP